MKLIDFLGRLLTPGKTSRVNEHFESEKCRLNIERFSVNMAINLLAGLLAKCEFKTYVKGKETRSDEYYLWNVEPNVNQNSSEFMQELVTKLLYCNEALVVSVGDQLLIADSYTQDTTQTLFPRTFSGVTVGSLRFDRSFSMSDVLYFRLNNEDVRALLSEMMAGYADLLKLAIGKYRRAGGRKGVVSVNRTASGTKQQDEQVDELFNKQFKNYFESENAVVNLPNGVKYEEITGEGSKKSTSEVNDIRAITAEAIARVGQAFRIPPALLEGNIADVDSLVDELLTTGVDPLADLIETEINRKRYGKEAFLSGTCLRIDTTCIKHIDIFSVAEKADKLISDGIYNVDEIRVKVGDAPLGTSWSREYVRTKNYEAVTTAGGKESETG